MSWFSVSSGTWSTRLAWDEKIVSSNLTIPTILKDPQLQFAYGKRINLTR